MHRHGYKGRKLSRTRDVRRLLIKNLATSLFEKGSLTTTLPKAKEVIPYSEKLITKAKKGDLHNRRQIMAKLTKPEVAHNLVDHMVGDLSARDSGYFRIIPQHYRRGDNALLVKITFVDDLSTKENDEETIQEIATDILPQSTEDESTKIKKGVATKQVQEAKK